MSTGERGVPESGGRPLPKWYGIKQALLDDINRGNYLPGHSFITEREVCGTFGVSRITAVRALNELVHDGVLVRHQGRGTFVAGGRDVPRRGGGAHLIGVVFHEIHGHHVMDILSGIQEVSQARGANVLLFDSTSQPELEAQNVRKARQAGVDGLIVYPVDGYANESSFVGAGPPLVMIDRYYPSLLTDAVLPDSFGAAHLVTSWLLERGHRRVAVVWGEVACTSVQESFAGYQRAIIEHDLEMEPELAALRPYGDVPERTRHAMLRSWLSSPDPPTAFVASNAHTLWVLRADLAALGIGIGDVTIGCFSDDNPTTLEAIGAVGATLPSRQMGLAAATLLLHRVEGVQGRSRRIVLPAVLRPARSFSAA
jgi:GntR family transcriptional regulator, arabinose operon transcriptional repressor